MKVGNLILGLVGVLVAAGLVPAAFFYDLQYTI